MGVFRYQPGVNDSRSADGEWSFFRESLTPGYFLYAEFATLFADRHNPLLHPGTSDPCNLPSVALQSPAAIIFWKVIGLVQRSEDAGHYGIADLAGPAGLPHFRRLAGHLLGC
jgi:hypothetical protein